MIYYFLANEDWLWTSTVGGVGKCRTTLIGDLRFKRRFGKRVGWPISYMAYLRIKQLIKNQTITVSDALKIRREC